MENKQNILVIGSGGREHAIIKKLNESPNLGTLFCSPANAGIAQDANAVNLKSHSDIISFCKENQIDIVIIGPEQPLVDGLTDDLESAGIRAFGPSKAAAEIEGSKQFMKDCLKKYNIPTASYAKFDNADEAKKYCEGHATPIVVKTDGLAAGKGVIIALSEQEAKDAIDEMFAGKFGTAGRKIIIEDFLDGEELSFFAFCDGKTAIPLGSAQDHKRIGEGDTGLNTGGMGTYSPAPVANGLEQQIMDIAITPLIEGLAKDGIEYKGFLFAGLMIKNGEIKVLEYNVRMGDPETQVIMPLLNEDLVTLTHKAVNQELNTLAEPVKFKTKNAVCVVLASKGYPESYKKGTIIKSLGTQEDNVIVYHAGTKLDDSNNLTATGGRVLGVTALDDSLASAVKNAYKAVEKIKWDNAYFRKDIAHRAL